MGFNCLKTTEPLQGGSLLFTAKLPEITGTHFIDLRRIKGWVDHGATQSLDIIILDIKKIMQIFCLTNSKQTTFLKALFQELYSEQQYSKHLML